MSFVARSRVRSQKRRPSKPSLSFLQRHPTMRPDRLQHDASRNPFPRPAAKRWPATATGVANTAAVQANATAPGSQTTRVPKIVGTSALPSKGESTMLPVEGPTEPVLSIQSHVGAMTRTVVIVWCIRAIRTAASEMTS